MKRVWIVPRVEGGDNTYLLLLIPCFKKTTGKTCNIFPYILNIDLIYDFNLCILLCKPDIEERSKHDAGYKYRMESRGRR